MSGESHALIIAEAAELLRSSRDWTRHVQTIFTRLGEGLGISRVYLFHVHELVGGGLGQTCLYDWAAPGLEALATDERNISERILQNDPLMDEWAERRRRGETISGHTRELDGYLRSEFEHQRIKSFLITPVMVNGQWWGHVGFDDCVKERDWSASERAVLRTFAYLLGDAIELSTSSLVLSEATRVAMLQTAPDGIIFLDEDGAVLEFNPAAEAIFGYRRTQVLGRPALPLVPRGRQRAFKYLLRNLQRRQARRMLGRRIETEGQHASGRTLPLELAITEIRQGGRQLFVAYVRDLTEEKRTQAEVARQREALHQSEKLTALGSLLAGVAHELNNPLSVVLGRAVMLEEDAKDPVQRERLAKLREAAERCAKVAKTFLAMARQTPSVRTAVSLNKAISTALELVAYPLRSSGVRVDARLDPLLPHVHADFDQMVQVFVNLFVNADHAMRDVEGDRIITVVTTSSADGRSVTAEVRDTGAGIDPAIRGRIFEPFFTTKSVGMGTGMGLAVSFGMVTAHDGSLEAVDNPQGSGACFRVVLPADPTAAQPSFTSGLLPRATSGRRILVVDDEPEIASLLSDILEREGHAVDRSPDGHDALGRLEKTTYDTVFCDLKMPGLDGRALRRRIVEKYPHYARRMVFVTGDLLGTARPGEDLDGCPLIEKPFHTSAIVETLAKISP